MLISISTLVVNVNALEVTQKLTSTEKQYGKGFRYNIQGWVYIHIEGDPYERGYQYGYLGYEEIIDMINRWSIWGREIKIMNLFSIKNPKYYWKLCKSIAMRTSWKQYPIIYREISLIDSFLPPFLSTVTILYSFWADASTSSLNLNGSGDICG